MSDAQSDFEIAKAVSDLLAGKDKERQHRVLRWVAESLDIALNSNATALVESPLQPSESRSQGDFSMLPKSATDIKTFMDTKQPRNDIQFATATAYYYRVEASAEQRRESITAEVLQDAARLVKRPRFARPVMTLTNAKNQGYLDPSGRGAYRVNSVGENLVAMTLPNTNESLQSPKRSAKKKTVQKKSASTKNKPVIKKRAR